MNAPQFTASFSASLKIPLLQQGKVLAQNGYPLWPALVLAACEGSSGPINAGIKVAAAIEILIASLDVLDEIEDGDFSPTRDAIGAGQALNVSTALLFLSQKLLLQSTVSAAPIKQIAFAQVLAEAGLEATVGQHLDLATEGAANISLMDSLEIARRKSGTLAGVACRLGAMTGTEDATILARYESFGRHFGSVLQLVNDLNDAENGLRKSDLHKQKGTLPLIYNRAAVQGSDNTPEDLLLSGALHFTWVVGELERQACADLLIELGAAGQDITALQSVLAKVE